MWRSGRAPPVRPKARRSDLGARSSDGVVGHDDGRHALDSPYPAPPSTTTGRQMRPSTHRNLGRATRRCGHRMTTTEPLIESRAARPGASLTPAVRRELYTNMVLGRVSRPRRSASTRPRGSAATATFPPARRRPASAPRTRWSPTICSSPATVATDSRSRGRLARVGHGPALRSQRRLCARSGRVDAPARRLAAGSTVGGGSSRASSRWRRVSRSGSYTNTGRRRCCASWATGR